MKSSTRVPTVKRLPAQETPAFRAAEAELYRQRTTALPNQTGTGRAVFPLLTLSPAVIDLYEAEKWHTGHSNGKRPIAIRSIKILFLLRDNGGCAWSDQLFKVLTYTDQGMVGVTCQTLEGANLLTYCESLFDRRYRFVELTPLGWEMVERLTPSREMIDEIYAETELDSIERRYSKLTQIPLDEIQSWREAESPVSLLEATMTDQTDDLDDAPEYQASSMTPSPLTEESEAELTEELTDESLPAAQCYSCGEELTGGKYPCENCNAD